MVGMDLSQLLEDSGAILRGHFLLSSGRHSDVYFEKFRVLEQPHVLSALCREIAHHFDSHEFDFVAGPLTGGIIIAFEVARQMELPAVYVESEGGRKALRRGKTLPPNSRVLVVDDVLTTGLSVKETIQAIEEAGAHAAGVAVLIDRAQGTIDFGAPYFAAYRVEAQSYAPDELPADLAALPLTKPGTRRT